MPDIFRVNGGNYAAAFRKYCKQKKITLSKFFLQAGLQALEGDKTKMQLPWVTLSDSRENDKVTRVNFRIREKELKQIDTAAKALGETRQVVLSLMLSRNSIADLKPKIYEANEDTVRVIKAYQHSIAELIDLTDQLVRQVHFLRLQEAIPDEITKKLEQDYFLLKREFKDHKKMIEKALWNGK